MSLRYSASCILASMTWPIGNHIPESQIMRLGFRLLRRVLVLSACALFLISLVLPALTSPEATVPGWFVFLLGWFGYVISEWRWYANVFFGIALVFVLSNERRLTIPAIVAASSSVLLATSCFWLPPKISTGGSSSPGVALATLEIGAYCWIAAHITLLFASLLPARARTPAPAKQMEK